MRSLRPVSRFLVAAHLHRWAVALATWEPQRKVRLISTVLHLGNDCVYTLACCRMTNRKNRT